MEVVELASSLPSNDRESSAASIAVAVVVVVVVVAFIFLSVASVRLISTVPLAAPLLEVPPLALGGGDGDDAGDNGGRRNASLAMTDLLLDGSSLRSTCLHLLAYGD